MNVTPFATEPPEWFPANADVLTFSMKDPDWLVHKPAPKCTTEEPHHESTCGLMRDRT